MSNYTSLKTAGQFSDFMKKLYFPSAKKIEEVAVPQMNFITFEGRGSPESVEFLEAIRSLYGIAFGLKMGFKFGKLAKPAGYFDFKVPPLEGLWWMKGKFDQTARNDWQWQVMIMMPAFVDQSMFKKAVTQAVAKHPELPYKKVKFAEFEEGKTIQTTHLGPYSAEGETIDRLLNYAKKYGYHLAGKHHEIYLSDPHRTKPEKLKTVLRYPVAA